MDVAYRSQKLGVLGKPKQCVVLLINISVYLVKLEGDADWTQETRGLILAVWIYSSRVRFLFCKMKSGAAYQHMCSLAC